MSMIAPRYAQAQTLRKEKTRMSPISQVRPAAAARHRCSMSRRGSAARILQPTLLIIPIFFIAAGVPSRASAEWEIQSALPTDRNITGVAFIDSGHGFMVGENRRILETTEGGASWDTDVAGEFGSDPFYAPPPARHHAGQP